MVIRAKTWGEKRCDARKAERARERRAISRKLKLCTQCHENKAQKGFAICDQCDYMRFLKRMEAKDAEQSQANSQRIEENEVSQVQALRALYNGACL